MEKYEGMFLLDSSRSTKDWEKVEAHVQDILTKNGAEIQLCEKWAERKLAYEIGHHRRAVYLLVHFLCPGPAIGRVRRACQLSDVIIRELITVYDEKATIAVEEVEGAGRARTATPEKKESTEKPEEAKEEAAEGEKPAEETGEPEPAEEPEPEKADEPELADEPDVVEEDEDETPAEAAEEAASEASSAEEPEPKQEES
ncbi:MAG: 30S ribosomal protein S6 [Planctomycetes bacterium]|nr:30S ribosomal protein S6 [Planctomycetota bacterium]